MVDVPAGQGVTINIQNAGGPQAGSTGAIAKQIAPAQRSSTAGQPATPNVLSIGRVGNAPPQGRSFSLGDFFGSSGFGSVFSGFATVGAGLLQSERDKKRRKLEREQNALDREFRAGETEKSREFTAGENALDREFREQQNNISQKLQVAIAGFNNTSRIRQQSTQAAGNRRQGQGLSQNIANIQAALLGRR